MGCGGRRCGGAVVMAKLMASSSVAETWWVVRVMVAVAVAVLAMVVGWLAGWLVERGRGIPKLPFSPVHSCRKFSAVLGVTSF